jgi:hypothetical protein
MILEPLAPKIVQSSVETELRATIHWYGTDMMFASDTALWS